MVELKVRKIGGSQGIILPKELLEKLRVQEGDTLAISETPEGIQLSAYDPDFARAMEGFGRVRRRYRDALRELAK
jgi:putative addiction module antidote